MAAVALVCPNCRTTSRTNRELWPGIEVRCARCGTASACFVHGNGAVELRPSEAPPPPEGDGFTFRLPPSVGEPEDAPRRTILTSRRKNRPIGGYHPFEKSRSYIGTFAFIALLGLGGVAGYWYYSQIDSLNTAAQHAGGRRGDAWRYRDDAQRREYVERQKKALAALKAREAAKRADKQGGQKL